MSDIGAGLAPLSRRGMDLAEGLTVAERLHLIEPLRRRQAELRARPTPPMIRVDEIDECIRIFVRGLLALEAERRDVVDSSPGDLDLDLTGRSGRVG